MLECNNMDYMKRAISLAQPGVRQAVLSGRRRCNRQRRPSNRTRVYTAAGSSPRLNYGFKRGRRARQSVSCLLLWNHAVISDEPHPCTGGLSQAGIQEVHAAMIDPNPQVNGKGLNDWKKPVLRHFLGEHINDAPE